MEFHRFVLSMKWIHSRGRSTTRQGRTQSTMLQMKRVFFWIYFPVACFALTGPVTIVTLLQFIPITFKTADDANDVNFRLALRVFYFVFLAYATMYMAYIGIGFNIVGIKMLTVSIEHGFSVEVLHAYLHKTNQMCANNRESMQSWNLITYGVGLLDSSLPEEYATGGRVLTMLIDKDVPLQVRRLLIRSPRQRIEKLIGTLAWRSPADQEMRWLAARIVEHLAADLNLARFPGALECISSLFDQDTLLLAFVYLQGTMDQVLPALRILENLAHNRHNCALIYNTNDLLSKIVAPVSSDKLVEDIRSSVAWTKVVDGSLKVVSRLMGSSGSSTGNDMCSNAVTNLVAILDMDMTSNSGIIELKMRAIEILTQLALHHPTKTSPREFIKKALHIFIATDWLENYWTNETQNMKEDKETASRLKEMAGEGLAMLSCDSKAINSVTECTDDHVRVLTELLDSNIKTIEYKINATDIVDIDINIGCRISAAVILKHLTNYNKETTLEKVFAELLPVQQAEAISTPGCWDGFLSICCRNDIENPSNRGQDEPSASQSNHIQQCGERRLQAELISLVAVNLESNNFEFAAILILPPRAPPVSLLEEFVVRLKKMVEDNMYATPACLAIQKLACKMVTGLLRHDENVELVGNKNIIGTLLKASKIMARFESSMLFAGLRHDCHGIPLSPLSSVLAKQAEDLLKLKKRAQALARAQLRRTNSAPTGVSPT